MSEAAQQHRYVRIALITIGAVYFLIMVGGIVRASGAGMGCPDWPTCFGHWVPPTDEGQLPANYHEIYAARGYADTRFNPVKTWTEYVNRLIGVSVGLLIITTVVLAVPLRRRDPGILSLSALVLLLVGFQGWLGSAVVASNLRPAMITAHMVTAFLIVCLLIYVAVRAMREDVSRFDFSGLPPKFRAVLIAAGVMTLIQIAMGTQIRESVDVIALLFKADDRHLWREEFPRIFYVHRSFSSVILLTNLWLAWTVTRALPSGHPYRRLGIVLAGLVVLAILVGISLDRLGFPAVAQPLHLVLANLVFGVQFAMLVIHRYVSNAPHPSRGATIRAQRHVG